jgi:methyl-accepting chemotaxis protein
MMLSRMKLGGKMLGGFGTVLLLMVVIAVMGIVRLGEMKGYLLKIVTDDTVQDALATQMSDQIYQMAISVRNIAFSEDPKFMEQQKTWIAEARRVYHEAHGKLDTMVSDAKAKSMLADIRQSYEAFTPLLDKALALGLKNENLEAGKVLMDEVQPIQIKLRGVLTEFKKYEAELTQKTVDASTLAYQEARLFMIVLSAVAVLGGVLLAIFLTRSITRPINRVVEGLTDGASQVASASAQVASSAQGLAEGSSEQAAGIEETSSSMEEMSSMTRQNAENASHANRLMGETSRVIEEASQSMEELNGSMKDISDASEETAKIIKTIDEIAFQTNLLALNAAVEAARAGEAGAGFAVVADEVRSLAMRAAEAAKTTADLIEGTVKRIKNGSDLVSRTNEAFARVASGARKVEDLVGEISAASQEQAQGILQINGAVSEMDKVVQQNASGAEEAAAAAEEMNAQAEQMKGFVLELVAVVNGSHGAHASGQGAGIQAFVSHQAPVGALTPVRKATLPQALPTLRKTAQAPASPGTGHFQSNGRAPSQVIPLDGDDLTDF